MKRYDKEKMKETLAELSKKLDKGDISIIAGLEEVHTVTIASYLKGNISILALADSIIERGNYILKTK
jgi:hypothetical protein